jgi:hypothetical protein
MQERRHTISLSLSLTHTELSLSHTHTHPCKQSCDLQKSPSGNLNNNIHLSSIFFSRHDFPFIFNRFFNVDRLNSTGITVNTFLSYFRFPYKLCLCFMHHFLSFILSKRRSNRYSLSLSLSHTHTHTYIPLVSVFKLEQCFFTI